MRILSASPLAPGTTRFSITPAHRRVAVGLIALTLVGVGCGGGGEQQTTLGEDRSPEDIAQCLAANGWEHMDRGFVIGSGKESYFVDAPSDGTTITLTETDIDKAFDETLNGAFRINGTDTAVDVDIGGISITDEERDQVYACAAEAQPVTTD